LREKQPFKEGKGMERNLPNTSSQVWPELKAVLSISQKNRQGYTLSSVLCAAEKCMQSKGILHGAPVTILREPLWGPNHHHLGED
jgi:hypothetical protein